MFATGVHEEEQEPPQAPAPEHAIDAAVRGARRRALRVPVHGTLLHDMAIDGQTGRPDWARDYEARFGPARLGPALRGLMTVSCRAGPGRHAELLAQARHYNHFLGSGRPDGTTGPPCLVSCQALSADRSRDSRPLQCRASCPHPTSVAERPNRPPPLVPRRRSRHLSFRGSATSIFLVGGEAGAGTILGPAGDGGRGGSRGRWRPVLPLAALEAATKPGPARDGGRGGSRGRWRSPARRVPKPPPPPPQGGEERNGGRELGLGWEGLSLYMIG
jgi:hypothetical protein